VGGEGWRELGRIGQSAAGDGEVELQLLRATARRSIWAAESQARGREWTWVHIPTPDARPALADRLGRAGAGRSLKTARRANYPAHVKSGSWRDPALASPRRYPIAPEVPRRCAESAYRGIDVEQWYRSLAPAGKTGDAIAN